MEIFGFIFVVIFCFGIVFLYFKMPIIKGKIGEMSVAFALSFLPKDEYITLNNVMLKNRASTTQIDHLVISVYGIFVIETKFHKGWIFGNTNKEYWTQNIWGQKYSLYNPVFQNQSHIRFLLRKYNALHGKGHWIFPVIVFPRASRIQITGDSACIMSLSHLGSFIRSHKQCIMSAEDCKLISSLIQNDNIQDTKERKRHKNNVQSAIYQNETKIRHGICPRCGGNLVLRTGKFGEFYGCSNYPNCHFTR